MLVLQTQLHFTVTNRGRQVEHAMEVWMSEFTNSYIGPHVREHVIDLESYWDWLTFSGLKMVYLDFEPTNASVA